MLLWRQVGSTSPYDFRHRNHAPFFAMAAHGEAEWLAGNAQNTYVKLLRILRRAEPP